MDVIRAAARSVGRRLQFPADARCSRCGHAWIVGLVRGTKPVLCSDCFALAQGTSPIEAHHPLGEANDPAKMALRSSTHRFFTDRQRDWDPLTLEHKGSCETLWRAAALHALADVTAFLVERIVLPRARALEARAAAAGAYVAA